MKHGPIELRLERGKKEFHFLLGEDDWRKALDLARIYGWSPSGTLAPPGWDPKDWHGDYLPFETGARVTNEDARALAAALKQALPDIPPGPALPVQKYLSSFRRWPPGDFVSPLEWFGGRKDEATKLVGFCLAGAFLIIPSPGGRQGD